MGTNFEVYVVVLPLVFMEIIVYWLCKVKADHRVIYQKYARDEWPKGRKYPNDHEENLNNTKTFESIQKQFLKS